MQVIRQADADDIDLGILEQVVGAGVLAGDGEFGHHLLTAIGDKIGDGGQLETRRR